MTLLRHFKVSLLWTLTQASAMTTSTATPLFPIDGVTKCLRTKIIARTSSVTIRVSVMTTKMVTETNATGMLIRIVQLVPQT